MFSQYDATIKTTIKFLNLLQVKVTPATVDETLQGHPDWPSLLSVSDSFNRWHIPNGAGRIESERIDELPVPFLSHGYDKEPYFFIVTKTDEKYVYTLTGSQNQTVREPREDFLGRWEGVYLLAEPDTASGEQGYSRQKTAMRIKQILPLAALLLIIVLSSARLYSTLGFFPFAFTVPVWIQYGLTVIGLIISVLLLWYEADRNNPFLKKVCTGITRGNCNAILTGKAARVTNWLSWSEVGFFYFAGAFLSLVFVGAYITEAVALVAVFNLLALPYPFFSIYYQWRIAKEWCVLCLAVQAVLIAGAVNVLSGNLLAGWEIISSNSILQSFLLYLLPFLIWFSVRPVLTKLQEAKTSKRDYLRVKFNTDIYETLLKKQKQVTIPSDELGIVIGNPLAKNTLIKVCNPYCGPCAKAHPEIESLLDEIPDLKVRIIFTTPNDEKHASIKPARHLLAIADEATRPEHVVAALDDWYNAKEKSYEKFTEKYPVNGAVMQQGHKLEAMHKWCTGMKIEFTPTLFINGFQLPEVYTIADLKYFLLE